MNIAEPQRAPVAAQESVCICIATFRRPALLQELLASIFASVANSGLAAPRVIVVDNDERRSAEGIVSAAPMVCEYIHEARPGIVAARNAALAALSEMDRWIIFVDDDETVDAEWFATLLSARRFDAAVVCGPVIPRYPSRTPRWVVRGEFFDRPRLASGTDNPYPATNNTLVDRARLEALDTPRFDERFSQTGGSDSELFARMRASGGAIVWCDDAVVYEIVPASRANLRWIWRRNVRLGNVARRVSLGHLGAIRVSALGAARMVVGTLLLTLDLLRARPHRRSVGHLAKGIGMIQAAIGINVQEYRRSVVGVDGSSA